MKRTVFILMSASLLSGMLQETFAADPKATKFVQDAIVRFDKKDNVGAIIQLKNALQIDKSMVDAQLLLGKALLRNGEALAAEVTLNEALRLGANRADLVVYLAQAYMAQGKQDLIFDLPQLSPTGLPPAAQVQIFVLRAAASTDMGDSRAALKAITEGRAIDPKSPDIWLAEVPVRIRAFQLKEAMEAVDKALVLAPESSAALYQKGAVLHAMGNSKDAVAAYGRALKVDPDHIEARVARAGLSIELNQISEAKLDLVGLQRLAPKEPRVSYMRALVAERDNKPDEVRTALKELVELIDPVPMAFIRYRPQILMLNGLAHLGLNEREKAKVYLEAFQKAQTDAPTAKILAQMYLRDANYDRAIEVLEAYLKFQPADGEAMAQLGTALMSKGQTARAASLMRQALQTKESPLFRTVLGLSLLKSGQTANAISELEQVLKSDPNQTQAAISLATTYLRNGQAAKAVTLLEKLVKQRPGNPGFVNLLGMAQGNANNISAAKASFNRAIKLDNNFASPKLNLARVEIAGKAYDAALVQLDAILKAEPKNMEAMFEMAVISDRKGQPADAQGWLEKANALAGPRETRWGLALAEFHLRYGRPAPALDVMKLVSSKAPDDLSVLLIYAKAQLANGDLTGVKSTLISATRAADYNPGPQIQIASLQMRAGNLGGAAYSLEKALSTKPDFLPALALMTDVEIRQGELVKAEKRARDIVSKHPRLAVGYSLQGEIANAKGQPAAAIAAYTKSHQVEPSSDTVLRLFTALTANKNDKQAVQLLEQWLKTRPKDLQVHNALADHQARSGNFAAAKIAFENTLKIAPQDIAALNNLANVLIQLKDPNSVNVAEQALALNPTNTNIQDTLGWALYNTGQMDRAVQTLRDARTKDPKNLEIRYHLAEALVKSGKNGEARNELESFVKGGGKLDDNPQAAALLKSLK